MTLYTRAAIGLLLVSSMIAYVHYGVDIAMPILESPTLPDAPDLATCREYENRYARRIRQLQTAAQLCDQALTPAARADVSASACCREARKEKARPGDCSYPTACVGLIDDWYCATAAQNGDVAKCYAAASKVGVAP